MLSNPLKRHFLLNRYIKQMSKHKYLGGSKVKSGFRPSKIVGLRTSIHKYQWCYFNLSKHILENKTLKFVLKNASFLLEGIFFNWEFCVQRQSQTSMELETKNVLFGCLCLVGFYNFQT